MAIFSPQRSHADDISWSRGRNGQMNLAYYIDCESYDGLQKVEEGYNFRHGWLGDPTNCENISIDAEVTEWVQRKGRFADPAKPLTNAVSKGGFRLLVIDRDHLHRGMTISRESFDTISSTFGLHSSTLTAFCFTGGLYAKSLSYDAASGALSGMTLVAKVCQKAEIANYLLSMSYDFTTGSTVAILCGDGAIMFREGYDVAYGQQLDQIMEAIKSTSSLWSHPLFLPTVLLGNYCHRIEIRTRTLERNLLSCEDNLGVTIGGGAGQKNLHSQLDWPNNVEVKSTTISLHSTNSQIFFMVAVCDWARRYLDFLQTLDIALEQGTLSTLGRNQQNSLRESLALIESALDSMHGHFSTLQKRAQIQIGVLYNVISQQDSKLNGSIAAAAKKDSIAMMTFTFITAIFLPGSYISSLFSMTMFNWQISSSKSSSSNSSTDVSQYFWIYWAVTIPLTLITLIGWFVWYRYSNLEWSETMNENLGIDLRFAKSKGSTGSKFDRLLRAISWSRK